MKRLLVATLALTSILTACSNGDEPIGEYADPEGKAEMEANLAKAEAEEASSVEEERHQFEVGPSKSDRESEEESDLERLQKSLSKVDEVSKDMSDELSEAIDNASIQTFEMNDVIIKVMGVERSKFAHGTLIDVEYAVENTVKERRMVPLERTIIVTNDGTQVEFDRDVSNLPEWDLVSDTKTEGTVSFYLKDVEPSEVDSVDVIVPGVDFKRSDDELFTVNFDE